MSIAFAIFLFIHGLAHVAGFVSETLLVNVETVHGPTLLLTGLDKGHWFLRLLGVVWLLVAVGFVLAGIGVLTGAEWTLSVLVTSTVASLILCVIWARDVPFGFAANAIIIAVLLLPALGDRVLPTDLPQT